MVVFTQEQAVSSAARSGKKSISQSPEPNRPSHPLKTSAQFIGMLWREQPRRVIGAVVLTIVNGLLGGCGILLLLPMLEAISEKQAAERHSITRLLMSFFESVGITPGLGPMLGVFLVLVGTQAWLRRQLTINNAKLRIEFGLSLQNRTFKSLAGVQWSFFIRQRLSDFIHVLTRDLSRVLNGTLTLLNLLSATVLVTVHVALSLVIAPGLSVVVLAATLLMAPILMKLNRLARQTGMDYASQSRNYMHRIEQQLAGMKEIKSLGAENQQTELFQNLTQAMRNAELKFNYANSSAAVVFTFGSALLLSGLLLLAVNVFHIATAELLILVVVFGRMAPQFRQVHGQYQNLLHCLASFDAAVTMQTELDRNSEDYTSVANLPAEDDGHAPHRKETCQSIELRDVSFRYDVGSDTQALQNINLKIAVNQTTALVGPSGSGKSTLADLLLGLLQPTSGQILVNGKTLEGSNLTQWRNRIGYVPQDTFLLHDSVRANLLLARPEADDSEIQNALDAASASDFVSQLPQGLDTAIGDRGVRISGGERQRLALARALLRRPEILILDEATSSLDTENQNRILTAIEQMHGKLTVVMIAHRLSTVRHADQIVVLERGHIVESGLYEELAQKNSGTFQSYLEADSLTGVENP